MHPSECLTQVSNHLAINVITTYYPNSVVQRKLSNRENFADFDEYVPEEEKLHLPGRKCQPLSLDIFDLSYLRPTAACFNSDLHMRNAVTTIAIPQRSIDPVHVSLLLQPPATVPPT